MINIQSHIFASRVDLAATSTAASHERGAGLSIARRLTSYGAVGAIAVAMLSSPAASQTTAEANDAVEDGIKEIVVVAQRREERLQDVPISISAVTAGTLQSRGITDTAALANTVAGLNITTQSGNIFPRLRGVGNSNLGPGFENGVAVYVDGVYIGTPQASLLSFNNIERIEVLKGPQGTLFGRNTTGGLIQVITRKPNVDPGGDFRVSYDNYQTLTVDMYVTGGLATNIAMDLAAHVSTQGEGYGTNLATGKDVYKQDEDIALRSSLLFSSERTEIRLTGDYNYAKGSRFARRPADGTLPALPAEPISDSWDTSTNFQSLNTFEGWGLAGTWIQDLGFADLTAITAYREARNEGNEDGDMTFTPGINLLLTQSDRQFSQEIQLSSSSDSSVSWIVGGYYFDNRAKFDPARVEFFGPIRPSIGPFGPANVQKVFATLDTESFAGFAQATVPLAESTNVTAGARYTAEKRSIDGVQLFELASGAPDFQAASRTDSKRNNKLTWRLSVDHRFSPEALAYASYNRGFKSGGYNGAAITSPAFDPETLDAFEAGLKTDLFDRHLRFNIAGFYYKYKDIQVPRYEPGATIIYNGAAARIYGIDVDFEAQITPELGLSGGIAFANSKFTDFPTAFYFEPGPAGGNIPRVDSGKGNELQEAPDITANITAVYSIPMHFGSIDLRGSYSYNDGYYAQVDNIRFQESFSLLDASITLAMDSGLSVQLWGKNLTDKAVTTTMASSNFVTAAGYRPPRTYGVTVGAKF